MSAPDPYLRLSRGAVGLIEGGGVWERFAAGSWSVSARLCRCDRSGLSSDLPAAGLPFLELRAASYSCCRPMHTTPSICSQYMTCCLAWLCAFLPENLETSLISDFPDANGATADCDTHLSCPNRTHSRQARAQPWNNPSHDPPMRWHVAVV